MCWKGEQSTQKHPLLSALMQLVQFHCFWIVRLVGPVLLCKGLPWLAWIWHSKEKNFIWKNICHFKEAWGGYHCTPESHQYSLTNITNSISNIAFSLTIINRKHFSVWFLKNFWSPRDMIWWNMYQMKVKRGHRLIKTYFLTSDDVSYTLSVQKEYFSWPNALYIFSGSPRDGEFPKTGHKMLAKWGIRLPNQFLSHNTLLQSKNQAKVAYFTKLMILIFWCPEEIRITNFTRMPLQGRLKLPCKTTTASPATRRRKFPTCQDIIVIGCRWLIWYW